MNSHAPAPQVAAPVVPKYAAPPTVSLYGCGGCGMNVLRNVLPALEKHVSGVRRLDTSYSNIRDGETMLQVATGDGAGKIRAEHSDAIQKSIAAYSDDDLATSDLNIVLFSLAGGKGLIN